MNKEIVKRLAEMEAQRTPRKVIVADNSGVMSKLSEAEAQRQAGPNDVVVVVEWLDGIEEESE